MRGVTVGTPRAPLTAPVAAETDRLGELLDAAGEWAPTLTATD
jgi:hypothetical protein